MRHWGFPEYETVAEKKAMAAKKLEQLRKKKPSIAPVVIEGNTLARTWWGKSWNRNLERYADYSNRIGRGKSYVRHGAVLDLKIEGGQATALVQGDEDRLLRLQRRVGKQSRADRRRGLQAQLFFDGLPGKPDEDFALLFVDHPYVSFV